MNSASRRFALVAALLALLAPSCDRRAPVTAAPEPLTPEALRSVEFRAMLPASGLARLAEGIYREPAAEGSSSEIVVSLGPWHALGDLDGDGVADAAAVLIESAGGSGSFFELVAVTAGARGPRHVASTLLGDRVLLESLAIEAGVLTVRLLTHGPRDPLCCPTRVATLQFRLEGTSLSRIAF